MPKLTVIEYQSLVDAALQVYGDMAEVARLIDENGLPGITAQLAIGQNLTTTTIDTPEQRTYREKGWEVATGAGLQLEMQPLPPEIPEENLPRAFTTGFSAGFDA